jgi:hypothetical protein
MMERWPSASHLRAKGRFNVNPTPFILKTALISSTLVPRPALHHELIPYVHAPQGVPVADWPQQQERREIPHLPHEEQSLRVTVDSSASGTYTNSSARSTHTNSSAQMAWLRNELSDKLIVITEENLLDGSFFLETPPNPKLYLRPQTKPLTAMSTRVRARARSGC